jgi:hypothetical protein
MKGIQKHLVAYFIFVFYLNASAQNIGISPFQIDTNQYRIDSVLNSVIIQDKSYTMIFIRDKYTEQMIPFKTSANGKMEYLREQAPITLLLVDKSTGKIMYQKKFENELNDFPYQNWLLIKGKDKKLDQMGKLFLTIERSYGGSSSINYTFIIDKSEVGITIQKVFSTSGELSDFMVSKNDQELILISGIWNTREKETHFSSHRYQIRKYKFINGQIKRIDLGITNFKYPPIDIENSCEAMIHQIREREKEFIKTLPAD